MVAAFLGFDLCGAAVPSFIRLFASVRSHRSLPEYCRRVVVVVAVAAVACLIFGLAGIMSSLAIVAVIAVLAFGVIFALRSLSGGGASSSGSAGKRPRMFKRTPNVPVHVRAWQ